MFTHPEAGLGRDGAGSREQTCSDRGWGAGVGATRRHSCWRRGGLAVAPGESRLWAGRSGGPAEQALQESEGGVESLWRPRWWE